jgi:hypothetical protein
MGALRDKIIQVVTNTSSDSGVYQPFDITFAATIPWYINPNLASTNITTNTTTGTIAYSSVGPYTETGSWLFGNNSRMRNSTPAASVSQIIDRDFSLGIWFMFPTLPTGTSATAAGIVGMNNMLAGLYVTGSGFTAAPSRLHVRLGTSTVNNYFGPTTIQANTWYYFAIRKSSTTNPNDFEIYLNGQYQATFSNSETSGINYLYVGSPLASSTQPVHISQYYASTYSQVDATDILGIWNAATGAGTVNINYAADPMLISNSVFVDSAIATTSNVNYLPDLMLVSDSDFIHPTIAVTNPNVNFNADPATASIELLTSITINTETYINITITETLDASADIVNNVIISTGSDFEDVPQPLEASALFVEPMPFAQDPMLASATMPNATVSVTPNYRNVIKQLNPSFYMGNSVRDGAQITNIINDGYENWGTLTSKGTGIIALASPNPMVAINDGYSYSNTSGSTSAQRFVLFDSASARTQANYFSNLNNNFTISFWVNFIPGSGTALDSIVNINGSYVDIRVSPTQVQLNMQGTDIAQDGYLSPSIQQTYTHNAGYNSWQHFAITVEYDPNVDVFAVSPNGKNITTKIWQNGSIVSTLNTKLYNPAITAATGIQIQDGGSLYLYFDEVAVYKSVLTNSEIINLYQFVATASPNRIIFPEPFEASADSGDHNFLVTSNVNHGPDPMLATNSVFVMPTLFLGVSKVVAADPMNCSADFVMPGIKIDTTATAELILVYAEKAESYFLNNTYFNYVKANVNPYRYVTFDADNVYADYGTDNDYSVVPTSIGGTILNPGQSINGKSAKTAGVSYSTDGVILKESEWNDNWGTGQNTYHSAFWFTRADDDASTTGLRVLWNLNGYLDNQHVILYQYQNKLHLNFNNGSGTWVDQATVSNINLFDYERHFVLIQFDHTNVNNNVVRLYIDSVLVMTVDLGSYTGTTVNASSADSGPNTEINNHPRLSVGCLITPFASTSLIVVPTETKIIVDEVYWAKSGASQTLINNLWNTMPDAANNNSAADAFEASALTVDPTYSTEAIIFSDPMNVSAELVDPIIYSEVFLVLTADLMTANIEMLGAQRLDSVQIFSDVMIATVIFDQAGILITIPAQPMIASAKLANQIGFKYYDVNGNYFATYLFEQNLTPLVRYLRLDALNASIPNFVEVK